MALSKLDARAEVELAHLQQEIYSFEECTDCISGEYPECAKGEYCNDHLKLMRMVQPHYVGMRTIVRQFYELRQLNEWLIQLDNLLLNCDYQGLKDHIEDNEKEEEESNDEQQPNVMSVYDEAAIYKTYAKQNARFQKEISDYPVHECGVCGCLL